MITVVLTCVGGFLTLETLEQLRADPDLPVRVIGVDANGDTDQRHFADAFVMLPSASADPESFVAAMRDLCRRERVDVVIPYADEEVLALSRARASFGSTRLAVEEASKIELLRDKVSLFDHLQAAGVPLPEYMAVNHASDLPAVAARLGYPISPFILKPRRGRGARGIVLVDAAAAAVEPPTSARGLLRGPLDAVTTELDARGGALDLMAMEFLPGTVHDVDCVAADGHPICLVPRRRLCRGPFSRGVEGHEIIRDAALETITASVARVLRMNFAFDCDFGIAADGRPGLLEVNPRLSGSVAAAAAGGVNVPNVLLRTVMGVPVPPQTVVPGARVVPIARLSIVEEKA